VGGPARQLAPSEPPLATSIERTRVNMAIGIDDAALQAQVQEVLAHCDALEIGDDDAVLEAYRRHTGLIPDTQRLTLYHALTALAYLAWRVDDPEAHDRLSGRDKAGAYRWVRQAVAWALA